MKIGIDPGVNTGFAKMVDGVMYEVKTLSIVEAMYALEFSNKWAKQNGLDLCVYIEDARKRKWIDPKAGRERLQGVGFVKANCDTWEKTCLYHDIDFVLVAPKDNCTKLTAEAFASITGWKGRTSVHARDAAMLVWGRR